MALLITKVLLLCLSVFGWFALFGFGYKNGSLDMISTKRITGCVGDACIPFHGSFTRIPRVDQHLAVLLTFFWPLVDGNRPDASLHCFYFAGQGIAIWTATMIEGLRKGNKGLIVSYTTIFGLLFQAVGMAVVGPIFLFLHLVTSPTLFGSSNVSMDVDAREVIAIPFSTFFGFIVPTILMSLHAPTYISFEQKTNLVRLWQIFPVMCYISQQFWKRVFSFRSTSAISDRQLQIQTLEKVYSFGIFCAAAAHLGSWTVATMAYMFPSLFARAVAHYLVPKAVFFPPMPWWDVKADSIASGAHWFLQWDNILTCSMYLLWACSLNLRAKKQAREKVYLTDVLGLVGSALLVGPAGAALLALKDRDRVHFSDAVRIAGGNAALQDRGSRLQKMVDKHFEMRTETKSSLSSVVSS